MASKYITRKLEKVNAVIKFVEDPCEAPWTLYFETALPAAGKALLTLLSFGVDDVVRGYARPKGVKGFSHLARKSRGRARGGGIPEIGEMIGKRLPGAEILREREVSNGVKHLWFVDGVLQRIAFWWMVADVVSDFAYDWTSLIAKSEFCQAPGIIGSLAASGGPTVYAAGSFGSPRLQNIEKARGGFFPPASTFLVPAGTRGEVTIGVNYGRWLVILPFGTFRLWLHDLTDDFTVASDIGADPAGRLIINADVRGGHLYQIRGTFATGPGVTSGEMMWVWSSAD